MRLKNITLDINVKKKKEFPSDLLNLAKSTTKKVAIPETFTNMHMYFRRSSRQLECSPRKRGRRYKVVRAQCVYQRIFSPIVYIRGMLSQKYKKRLHG